MKLGYKKPSYTPERIDSLQPGEIFVFGSNLNGYHGGGAARAALDCFGAVWGKGVGPQGQSYAIPTMHGGPEAIQPYVNQFITYAKEHQELTFLVTPIGCGLAGFSTKEIAPLFKEALNVENIVLPKSFINYFMELVNPQLPDYLKTKTYGQTRTLVDMLIELNKIHHYSSVEDALKDLFNHLEHIRTDGDEVAFNCSVRSLYSFAHKAFVNDKLDLKRLESLLNHDFYKGIDKVYEKYVIERTIILISYLNDFRCYDNAGQVYDDFVRVTGGVNHCGIEPSNYFFGFSESYVSCFLRRYMDQFWEEFSHNGLLDNELFFDFMIGRHRRGVEKYGLEAVINRNYASDGPCHPEVYFPYRGGAGPVYVKTPLMNAKMEEGKRKFIKSCGEGKGPFAMSDYFEFGRIRPLIEEDKKYMKYKNYYLPKENVSLPVFDDFWGRILFESPEAQAEFIRNAWSELKETK